MSKETFWEAVDSSNEYQALAMEIIRKIEQHGGTIGWKVEPSEPKEPPPPAVCTCINHPSFWDNQPENEGKDKPGPWHGKSCPLWTPF